MQLHFTAFTAFGAAPPAFCGFFTFIATSHCTLTFEAFMACMTCGMVSIGWRRRNLEWSRLPKRWRSQKLLKDTNVELTTRIMMKKYNTANNAQCGTLILSPRIKRSVLFSLKRTRGGINTVKWSPNLTKTISSTARRQNAFAPRPRPRRINSKALPTTK